MIGSLKYDVSATFNEVAFKSVYLCTRDAKMLSKGAAQLRCMRSEYTCQNPADAVCECDFFFDTSGLPLEFGESYKQTLHHILSARPSTSVFVSFLVFLIHSATLSRSVIHTNGFCLRRADKHLRTCGILHAQRFLFEGLWKAI